MGESVIRVRDLYKIYRVGNNKVRALNGVDFEIEKGEFCCIVGTSGSGKSTLLNMMAGLEKPTKGQIVIAGEHIEKKSESQLVLFRQAHVGFIFQSYNLLPNMTALENVAMPLTFQGVDKQIRELRAKRMLKLVGLEKYSKHRPGQMSGGQQQRVGIARALVVEPEIVFADEPTGNLDSNTTMEVLQLIRKIVHEKGQTMVMVTHDNYLASFGDRVIHIRDGKILRIDDNRGKSMEERLGNGGNEMGGTLDGATLEMLDAAKTTGVSNTAVAAEISNALNVPATAEAAEISNIPGVPKVPQTQASPSGLWEEVAAAQKASDDK